MATVASLSPRMHRCLPIPRPTARRRSRAAGLRNRRASLQKSTSYSLPCFARRRFCSLLSTVAPFLQGFRAPLAPSSFKQRSTRVEPRHSARKRTQRDAPHLERPQHERGPLERDEVVREVAPRAHARHDVLVDHHLAVQQCFVLQRARALRTAPGSAQNLARTRRPGRRGALCAHPQSETSHRPGRNAPGA
jgi:hypothetical protein